MPENDHFSSTLTSRTHKLYGPELFPGIGTPLSRTTRYGATFAGRESGGVSLTFAGWVNYTPIFFKPSTECTVVGGRWVLVTNGGQRGVLYGSFTSGTVRWNATAKLAEVSVGLAVSGGTKAYRRLCSAGELTGALNHLPFPPLPPQFGGALELW